FKIVHVRFGREIVEVATFRAPHEESSADTNVSDAGMILSDNFYGDFDEDVHRRDFTMNALYYDADAQTIEDLVDGLGDIERKQIRLIGEPDNRYREDPVRMLRAVRFKAKLGFEIDERTAKPLTEIGFLLQDIPAARLFEEVLKMFMSGHGEASFATLQEYDLFGWLFPATNQAIRLQATNHDRAEKLIQLALASTDKRIANDQPVTPAFVYAALLWYPFLLEQQKLVDEGATNVFAFHEAASNVVAKQQLFTSIPRRFSGPMREIWQLQPRLPMKYGKKPELLMGHKRFRAAYDFLLLRETSGEQLDGLGDWWTKFQENAPEQRLEMTRNEPKPKRKRRRKRRPRRL
ncbi:MAG TPA: polynucleotide adenylyltransferase PcnB, partial [Pseudomonadales bacterium]|nr:polynucleotide adenylyltransferase PcnB [Pseudomonadales bacterium]